METNKGFFPAKPYMANMTSKVAKKYEHAVLSKSEPGALAFCKNESVATMMAHLCNCSVDPEARQAIIQRAAESATLDLVKTLPEGKTVDTAEVQQSFELAIDALLKELTQKRFS